MPVGGPRMIRITRDDKLPPVNADTALTLSAYWACVAAISSDLAKVPWNVFEKLPGGGRSPADRHVVDWLLSTQPNPEMTAFSCRQAWIAAALTHGNGVLEIVRDAAGRPAELWPVEPYRVTPRRDESGGLVYRVTNYGRPDSTLDPADVLHLRAMGDGVWGRSVVEYGARSLGIALTTDRNAGRVFGNNGRPSGAIEKKGKLSPEGGARYRKDWERMHSGDNPGAVAIMEEGDKFTPFPQISPQDAQLIESRKFAAEDVCRWFRVPPHKVGLLDRATNNNIESQGQDYIDSALLSWATQAEQEANLKLFGQKQRGVFYTKFNFGALMRGDSAARSQYLTRMVLAGLMCPDEAREREDLNPIPGGHGRKFFVPVNIQTIERAVNPPPAAPPKSADGPHEPAAADGATETDRSEGSDGAKPPDSQDLAVRPPDPAETLAAALEPVGPVLHGVTTGGEGS